MSIIAALKGFVEWFKTPERPETKWSHIQPDSELIKKIHQAHADQDWQLHEELCDELADRDLWGMAP